MFNQRALPFVGNALYFENPMIGILIKVILGLFVWMVLPKLIFQKRSKKKAPFRSFTFVVCMIIGILFIVYGVIDLFKLLLKWYI